MTKDAPIHLTKNEWKLYEKASHKLKLINDREDRSFETLQERHHENYRKQRVELAAKLSLVQSPDVVLQLKRDGLLRPDDVEGE